MDAAGTHAERLLARARELWRAAGNGLLYRATGQRVGAPPRSADLRSVHGQDEGGGCELVLHRQTPIPEG